MKTLVVARWQEDTSWYADVPDDWTLLQVQKGREVPNTGREPASFLWAILRLYDNLAADDLVACVQGDPFPHVLDIDLFLLLAHPTPGFRALGDYTYVSGGDGAPAHEGLPVAERYEEWFRKKWPGGVRFCPGGQFVVTGRDIHRHPKTVYENLMAAMSVDRNPWVMERLWPTLFETPRPLEATFYCQATPVTTYLRCELPARYLPGKVSRDCMYAQDDQDFWFPDHQGAAVFQFAGDRYFAAMVHGLQHKGVRVLMEADDNYFTVSPSMKRTGWGKTIKQSPHSFEGHANILKYVDGCIVTTEQLARQYRKHNPNVFVAPNTVDPIDWPVYKKRDDGVLRIGWFASMSHGPDGKLVHKAMEWASRQKNVEVWTMGHRPAWKFKHNHIPWQDMPGYREALYLLDVGVAPIVGTPWALCRSDLKALEYGVAGAVPVLSDVAPYSLFRDGENCLKAKTPDEFLKRVQRLAADRDETKQLAAAARSYVLKERTTESQIGLWRNALAAH